jgi:uncharacterized repeat protein (TIGR01451 family)
MKKVELCILVVFFAVFFNSLAFAGFPSDHKLSLGDGSWGSHKNSVTPVCPYFLITLDAAGYSDWLLYGYSPDHNKEYHELLSGEWGGAVYYDGIDTELVDPNNPLEPHKADWLTNWFSYPDWDTQTKFRVPADEAKLPFAMDNLNNPVTDPAWPVTDTGFSYVQDRFLEVRIDYEIADLERSTATIKRSPMLYREPNSVETSVAFSDRYVLLQTYTFRNIDPNNHPMTNLQFYQFLHSHGADEYGPMVNSCYESSSAPDALQYYQPFDPIHQVGNFRYDITQWNSRPYFSSWITHIDFVGFSCTRQPDWVDNDVYEGGHWYASKRGTYTPPRGTHHHIENRQLNGVTGIYKTEAAAAMGWNMGTLNPNQTTSITIAYMFGPEQENDRDLMLFKTAALPAGKTAVGPGDDITYTLQASNISSRPAYNAYLIDYLPPGMDYLDVSDPNYNAAERSYTWTLGTVAGSQEVVKTITFKVNRKSEPGRFLHNIAEFRTSLGKVSKPQDTPVESWDNDNGVIYVDTRATGYNNGIDWANAYTDLQDAMTRAKTDYCNEIWVARGSYNPGRAADKKFEISAGVWLLGGFAGDEKSKDRRNIEANPTILSGLIDAAHRNITVVTLGNLSLLDGFIVQDAGGSPESPGQGILCKDVSAEIVNCTVKDNLQYGIYADNSDVGLHWSQVVKNGFEGIRHLGSNKSIFIENCRLNDNQRYGLYLDKSTPAIKNSEICRNGFMSIVYPSIQIKNPSEMPLLYNTTIAYNNNEAINYIEDDEGSDPNHTRVPNIQNCIIWYNNQIGGGEQFAGWSIAPHYSCVYNPGDPSGLNDAIYGDQNFSHRPDFAYPYISDPNFPVNVHLTANSFCKDKGNLNLSYTGQTDMDHETRVIGTAADIGADEIDPACTDVYNACDRTNDGVVNMGEWNMFADLWQARDPNDPAILDPNNPVNDPNGPDYIERGRLENWYSVAYRYNFSTEGTSRYAIDAADLMEFLESAPWLWTACWRKDLRQNMDSNPWDFNGDGLINYDEFNLFSRAWLSRDPNDPQNPNSDQSAHWDKRCNVATGGDSRYRIDEVDLMAFIESAPWLWIADWRPEVNNDGDFNSDKRVNMADFEILANTWLSQSGDMEWNPKCDLDNNGQIDISDLALLIDSPWLWIAWGQSSPVGWAVPTQQNSALPQEPQTEPSPPQEAQQPQTEELSLSQQIADLLDSIAFLENLWLTDEQIQQEIPAEEWQAFMDTLYASLNELQSLITLPVPEDTEPSIEQQIADLQDSITFLENLWQTDEQIQQEITVADWQAFMDELYAQLADLESQLSSGDPNDPNSPFYGMSMMMSQSMFESRGMFNESQSANSQESSDLQEMMEFLNQISNDPQFQQEINTADWQQFINDVYNNLSVPEGNIQ